MNAITTTQHEEEPTMNLADVIRQVLPFRRSAPENAVRAQRAKLQAKEEARATIDAAVADAQRALDGATKNKAATLDPAMSALEEAKARHEAAGRSCAESPTPKTQTAFEDAIEALERSKRKVGAIEEAANAHVARATAALDAAIAQQSELAAEIEAAHESLQAAELREYASVERLHQSFVDDGFVAHLFKLNDGWYAREFALAAAMTSAEQHAAIGAGRLDAPSSYHLVIDVADALADRGVVINEREMVEVVAAVQTIARVLTHAKASRGELKRGRENLRRLRESKTARGAAHLLLEEQADGRVGTDQDRDRALRALGRGGEADALPYALRVRREAEEKRAREAEAREATRLAEDQARRLAWQRELAARGLPNDTPFPFEDQSPPTTCTIVLPAKGRVGLAFQAENEPLPPPYELGSSGSFVPIADEDESEEQS